MDNNRKKHKHPLFIVGALIVCVFIIGFSYLHLRGDLIKPNDKGSTNALLPQEGYPKKEVMKPTYVLKPCKGRIGKIFQIRLTRPGSEQLRHDLLELAVQQSIEQARYYKKRWGISNWYHDIDLTPEIIEPVLRSAQHVILYSNGFCDNAFGARNIFAELDRPGTVVLTFSCLSGNLDSLCEASRREIHRGGRKLAKRIRAIGLYNQRLSLLGHSMGGIFLRSMLRHIEVETPHWWSDNRVELTNIVTVASPHVSAVGVPWLFRWARAIVRFFSRVFLAICSLLISIIVPWNRFEVWLHNFAWFRALCYAWGWLGIKAIHFLGGNAMQSDYCTRSVIRKNLLLDRSQDSLKQDVLDIIEQETKLNLNSVDQLLLDEKDLVTDILLDKYAERSLRRSRNGLFLYNQVGFDSDIVYPSTGFFAFGIEDRLVQKCKAKDGQVVPFTESDLQRSRHDLDRFASQKKPVKNVASKLELIVQRFTAMNLKVHYRAVYYSQYTLASHIKIIDWSWDHVWPVWFSFLPWTLIDAKKKHGVVLQIAADMLDRP